MLWIIFILAVLTRSKARGGEPDQQKWRIPKINESLGRKPTAKVKKSSKVKKIDSLVYSPQMIKQMTIQERLQLYEKWQETKQGKQSKMFEIVRSKLWKGGFGVVVTGHYGPAHVGTIIPFKCEVWSKREYEVEMRKRDPPSLPDGYDSIHLKNAKRWVYVTKNTALDGEKLLGNWCNCPLRLNDKNIEDGWSYEKQLRNPISNKPVPDSLVSWFKEPNMKFGVIFTGSQRKRYNHILYGRLIKTVPRNMELLIRYGRQYKLELGVYEDEVRKHIELHRREKGNRSKKYSRACV
mmetsp:Transcript_8384/g.8552  ORF Transcript_8384/g.8552 Transcript_8384/m.8552 type:complete len:294 (-) Transcript_8384:37-918(-)